MVTLISHCTLSLFGEHQKQPTSPVASYKFITGAATSVGGKLWAMTSRTAGEMTRKGHARATALSQQRAGDRRNSAGADGLGGGYSRRSSAWSGLVDLQLALGIGVCMIPDWAEAKCKMVWEAAGMCALGLSSP